MYYVISAGLSLHEQSNFIDNKESEEVQMEDLFKAGKQKQYIYVHE